MASPVMTMTCGRYSATTFQTCAASNFGSKMTVFPENRALNVGISADVWISGGSMHHRIGSAAAAPPRDCWYSSAIGSPE